MILSASRRTDIPAFHSEWMMNRLRDGRLMVRNPGFRSMVYDVDVSPGNVDAVIFLTKNPSPMTGMIDEILSMGHRPFFQVTITGNGRGIEPNVPDLRKTTDAFRRISGKIGPDRMIWRYDPVLLSAGIGAEEHAERFSEICSLLEGHTGRCVFGFLEPHAKLSAKIASGALREASGEEMRAVAEALLPIAESAGMELTSCCTGTALEGTGVKDVGCIDEDTMRRSGIPFTRYSVPQREGCTCVKTFDVGTYGTCFHDCIYCYANPASPGRRTSDPDSLMLGDSLREGDEIIKVGKRQRLLSDF